MNMMTRRTLPFIAIIFFAFIVFLFSLWDIIYHEQWLERILALYAILILLTFLFLVSHEKKKPLNKKNVDEFEKTLEGKLQHFICPSCGGIFAIKKSNQDKVSERLNFAEMIGNCGIVQLRWATFGAPSQANAQPHMDSDGDLVGAHNGNVVNNVELRQQFIDEGMTVRSVNDGESCVHAVERYVDRGLSVFEAIRCAYRDLAGDYSFVIARVGEDNMYAIKKGSGLVIGIADDATCVSSDLPISILPLTRRILRVHDGEIVTLWHDRVEIRRVDDGHLVDREIEYVSEGMESAQKGGYPHYMLKEIHEQPHVAGELVHLLEDSPSVLPMIERMSSARHLYLIGCGTIPRARRYLTLIQSSS